MDDSFYFSIGDECVIGLYYVMDQVGYYAGKGWVSIYAERSYFLPGENEGEFVSPYGLLYEIVGIGDVINFEFSCKDFFDSHILMWYTERQKENF